VLALFLRVAGAYAQEVEVDPVVRYSGRIVALRSLVAPRGGLPSESLEPLLKVQQDSLYDPFSVRQDIAMLHRVLDFAKVEVDVEDWVAFDASGAPVPGVKVEYRVYPPPRLVRVEVDGARVLTRRALLGVVGREPGDAFFPEDAGRVRAAVLAAYAELGYPRAEVAATVAEEGDDRVSLLLAIEEGEPDRIDEISVSGGGTHLWPQFTLARHGLVRGRPWTRQALAAAQDDLTDLLRARGWYEGRVTVDVAPVDSGGERLVVLVDPRRRWSIVRETPKLPSKARIERILALRDGVRSSRRFSLEATRQLDAALYEEGRLETRTTVALEESEDAVLMRVGGNVGPGHRLGRVTWEGDTVHDGPFLTGALREAGAPAIGPGRITPEAVDDALEELQEFYRSEGYLSAKLARIGFFERAAVEQRGAAVVPVDLRIRVDAGPRVMLNELTIQGAANEADVSGIYAELVGRPLNPAEIDLRNRRLVEALAERGYLGADARSSIQVSEDGVAADVLVEVTTGPVVYLRSVILRGHRRTRRGMIEREIDVAIGEPLAPSRIAGIRRRLYEQGLYRRVDVELVGDEDRVKDLIVDVEERPNLYAELGGGVATDQGLKLFARGGHRNLFGLGHGLTLLGETGIGWVGDGWLLDWPAPEWKAAARYEALPTRNERVSIDVVFNEQQQEPAWRLERSGAGVGVGLRLGPKATAEVAYRVQFRRMLELDPDLLAVGDPWLDAVYPKGEGLTLPSLVRSQSGLEVSFVLDLRDDPFNPTRGSVGSVVVNLADELLTDLTFLRGEGTWGWWLPVGPFGIQGRLRGGAAWTPFAEETLPLEDRFQLGGGASLRGFALDSVGPANRMSVPEVVDTSSGPILGIFQGEPAAWIATGGDAMALASFEFRIPFERIGLPALTGTELALFADVGNVWFLDADRTDSMVEDTDPLLRWSVGVGLRRTTAIGPIQLDLGFNPQRMTERGEELLRIHLSLGAL
jgi:translocation and assembly module TamA